MGKPKAKDYQEHTLRMTQSRVLEECACWQAREHTGTLLSPQNPLQGTPATFFKGLSLGHLQLEGWKSQEFLSLKVTSS